MTLKNLISFSFAEKMKKETLLGLAAASTVVGTLATEVAIKDTGLAPISNIVSLGTGTAIGGLVIASELLGEDDDE
ncbi:MAG: hypothetical protein F6K50_06330 [Moorea sp. SIO3I7]|nr:hypothetical protein [Moorena sp. SIO3I7]